MYKDFIRGNAYIKGNREETGQGWERYESKIQSDPK